MNRNVPAESDTYVYDGARVRVLRSGTQTNGVFALLEATLLPGAMAAPHSHAHEEETPYVLEGTLCVETQGRTIALSPGETATLPRNVPHRLGNTSTGVTRILLLATPAGFDEFVKEIGQRLDDPAAPAAPMTEARIAQLDEAASRYGITVVAEAEL